MSAGIQESGGHRPPLQGVLLHVAWIPPKLAPRRVIDMIRLCQSQSFR